MGKTKSEKEKPSSKESKKKKSKKVKIDTPDTTPPDSPVPTPDSSASQNGEGLTDIEQAITELRERGKEDPELDFVKELRKIQDRISDVKGEERRPITAMPAGSKKKKEKEVAFQVKEEPETTEDEEDDSEKDTEGEEEDEDPDSQIKELINKRLTTCMMLALSFESDTDYPRDFYEKLSQSNKFKEVTQPFKKEEMQLLNQLIKDRKKSAQKRLKECSRP